MTDVEVDAPREDDARLAWRIGGTLFLACAAVSVIQPFLAGSPALAVALWVRTGLFAAALIVFARGVRGSGSVVARQPLGVVAMLVLALVMVLDGVVSVVVPFSMDLVDFFMTWNYVVPAIELGAAIVTVIVIARAGVVRRPWRWVPLWVLVAAAAPQLVLLAVVASPGADVQAMAGPMYGFSQLMSIAVPLTLAVGAMFLSLDRPEPRTVQIFPPAD
jgi:hypothetical protein